MPIDPSALLNLWSLEVLPACDEGMEHARAFLTSAGEAVSNIENHDPRLLLREFVVLFRIVAAHGCRRVNKPFLADVFSRSDAAIAKRIRPPDYSEHAISFTLQPCVGMTHALEDGLVEL